ncbi:Histone deacetylase complex subunit, variant 2 [Entomophthora muscae]|uniref:Histone deacetylase complex subunit, variant 2 n=1 Tax=Entomophthora muscae TaxID=34485 RepID=A0ACC2RIM3_9FUNG|nr:Histone deacetylase complex subunit, variant 2 [Entomophthora muscae]
MSSRGGRRSGKETSRALSDEEKDGVTRCICGEKKSQGLMIQCKKCKVWQHCICVKIPDKEIPRTYYCELCQATPPFDPNHIIKPDISRRSALRREAGSSVDPQPSITSRKHHGLTSKESEAHKDKASSVPLKIRLNIPEKEGNTSCSSVNSRDDKPSPREFTTKRGRKTTRVTYNTYSEEEHEVLEVNVSASSISPAKSDSPKINKETDDRLGEFPKKRKWKESRRKRTPDSKISRNLLASPSPVHDASYIPMTAYQKVILPKLPHENNDKDSFNNEKWYTSPTISVSKYAPPALLARSVSPPPKPRNVSVKMSLKEMNKRVKSMHQAIELHQCQLKEHIRSTPEIYKSQKQHYSTSTKMSKEILQSLDSFHEKFKRPVSCASSISDKLI